MTKARLTGEPFALFEESYGMDLPGIEQARRYVMAKHEDTHRKATSQDDARLPATTRHNIDEPPHRHQSPSDDSRSGESNSGQADSDTAKDINVVRGDDRPQSVRHGG